MFLRTEQCIYPHEFGPIGFVSHYVVYLSLLLTQLPFTVKSQLLKPLTCVVQSATGLNPPSVLHFLSIHLPCSSLSLSISSPRTSLAHRRDGQQRKTTTSHLLKKKVMYKNKIRLRLKQIWVFFCMHQRLWVRWSLK